MLIGYAHYRKMKSKSNSKLFLPLLIYLFSNFAYADYQLIHTAKDNTKYYVDLTSRTFNGSSVKVWEYANYGTRTELGEMSVRALMEYECDKKEWRTVHFMSYSKPNFEGVLVAQLKKNKADWHKAVDGQANMILLNQVCKVEG